MNERDYIADLAAASAAVPGLTRDMIRGMGDDCAVLAAGPNRVQLVSVDTLVENIHFDRRFHPPKLLGRKIVAVNVSDIAAMGGEPCFALLSSGLPPGFDEDWVRALNQGILAACRDFGCALIGGDTVASPGGFCFSLTILGEMAGDQVLYRNKAQAGDTVFISGDPGFAAAGLALLQRGQGREEAAFAPLLARHLNPEPRLELGRRLAAGGLVHAMMDSSDGPATDLAHICAASGLGARLFAQALPLPENLRAAARLLGVDPLDWVLKGGEDFELIFTASPEAEAALRDIARACDLALHAVGTMDGDDAGLRLVMADGREEAVAYQGFDHFLSCL